MGLRIRDIVLDATELHPLAEFWSEVTGRPIKGSGEPYLALRDPEGRDAGLILQKVPEPKAGKNRAHFDLYTADPTADAERLVRLGARIVRDFQPEGEGWIWMEDPQGNEFCLCKADPAEL